MHRLSSVQNQLGWGSEKVGRLGERVEQGPRLRSVKVAFESQVTVPIRWPFSCPELAGVMGDSTAVETGLPFLGSLLQESLESPA